MGRVSSADITGLLLAWNEGEGGALEKLTPLVHDELHRLAHRYMRGERDGHTLQTTALVNEAYLKLVDSRRVQWQDRAHFLAIAAQLMRRILVDFARSRRAAKRGGGDRPISLDEATVAAPTLGEDLVELDEALQGLAGFDARKARVVELRFFGGLKVRETAQVLEVSEDTVHRDWRLAKIWLLRELEREGRPG